MALGSIGAGTILIVIVLVALPIAAVAFATGAGRALRRVGGGELAIVREPDRGGASEPASPAVRREEVRQMVEAREHRRRARGEAPVDVEAEVERLLGSPPDTPTLGEDAGLRDEVRQLVVATNERRRRRGEEPLEVEAEVERRLTELARLDD
jgi:hypothetical protein